MPISPEIDTVLARCGDAEPKLVYRIPEVETKAGHYNQLAPLPNALNVVTLFVDSISRPMFHRRLPKTVAALELAGHSPEATGKNISSSPATLFDFFRFHTVGINTGPNTRALWAGLEDDGSEGVPLWEQFRDAGYVTGRADSMCQDVRLCPLSPSSKLLSAPLICFDLQMRLTLT